MQPEHCEKTLATMMDTIYVVREPYGVALLLGPFNYPLFLIILSLIPLIAAGNTVIIKPSELVPNCAKALDELFSEHFEKVRLELFGKDKFFQNFIVVIQTDTTGVIELLRERFDIIMFTGSCSVGKAIMKAAAEHLTPVVLELGGKW
jgi:acyl-CoA reductase-like NAD-dependent aldehyde dehydrogenase